MAYPKSNNGNLFSFADGATRKQVTDWATAEFKTEESNLLVKPADGLGLRWHVQKLR